MHYARHYGPFILVAFLLLAAWGQYNAQQPLPYERAVLIEVNDGLLVERVHQSEFRPWLKKYVQRKSRQAGGISASNCTEFWAVPQAIVGTPKLQAIIGGRNHVVLDSSPLQGDKSILAMSQ
ncbi:MAG: hypothetical protein K2W82_15750 [Candidatus Obscuribacterales bacterium]|nr:hypothetical protein [Candidatus Obscuribacterales bacterium]